MANDDFDDYSYEDEAYEVLSSKKYQDDPDEDNTSNDFLDIQQRLMKAIADMGFDLSNPKKMEGFSYEDAYQAFMLIIDSTEWDRHEIPHVEKIKKKLEEAKKKALEKLYLTVHNFCLEVIS